MVSERQARWALVGALVLGGGCGAGKEAGDTGGPFVQPGLDDPTARRWTRAGEWYPEDPRALDREVQRHVDAVGPVERRPARALLTPHAALAYSGPVAAEAWARITPPDTVVVLAPNHFDDGVDEAIWTEGPWLVPGHALAIDAALTARIQELDPGLVSDREAFAHHEVEMNLPFLQWANPDMELVVIGLRDNQDWDFRGFGLDRVRALGSAVATAIAEREAAGDEVLLVITTDFSHYEPLVDVEAKDPVLMEHVATLDEDGLYEDVLDQGLTICGEVPAAVGMVALQQLGETGFDFTVLGSSYTRAQDPSYVIGYPAGVIYR